MNKVTLSKPCIIHDMHGVVLTWYLPGILNDSRQVGLFNLVRLLRKPYFISGRNDGSNGEVASSVESVETEQDQLAR